MKRKASPSHYSEEEQESKRPRLGEQQTTSTMADVITWVREKNLEELKKFLEETNINDTEPDKEDAVASQRRAEIFGAGTFAAGMTTLLWAVEDSNKEISELLLKYYPSLINKGDLEGATPLHYASMNGDIDMVKFLLSKNASILPDSHGETPLHLASLNGHQEVVQLLIQIGADPNTQSETCSTPLHLAVINKQLKVISILLSHPKIDTKIQDDRKRTAKMLAIEGGNKAVIDYFEDEKREKLVQIEVLQDTLTELKERIRVYEERREQDQRSISVAYKKLADEEAAHRISKETIEDLNNQLKSRTLTEMEQKELELNSIILQLSDENKKLKSEILELTHKEHLNQKHIDDQVTHAHRTLSNLLTLLDTTNLAIVSAKTEVESVRKFMRVPENESNKLPN
eukprot:TRINITY_DN2088_c0_g1_i3.p1 TRINITY_DN2088_c0_g1~~TRINITY_DN2088_c0_g1_i3.p1  ORF type:complete len:401 (+),score=69.02 TRINITY_DN2088_c0_g1_i3:528-1730(+)